MAKNLRDQLAEEAAEAREVAAAEEIGERAPARTQRARRQAVEPSQVYSIRLPVDRLEELRALADERGVAPTALVRQFVLERLEHETREFVVSLDRPKRDPDEIRLGPSRRSEAQVVPIALARAGSREPASRAGTRREDAR